MNEIIDGVISIILSYVVNARLAPFFEKVTKLRLSQGYSMSAIEYELNQYELVFQILAFIVVFSACKLFRGVFLRNDKNRI